MLPYTAWMKNVATTTVRKAALAQFVFAVYAAGLQLVDTDGDPFWDPQAEGADGSVTTTSPQHFDITTPQFVPGMVNMWLAVRDDTNPRNSGVYPITGVDGDGMGVSLLAPIASWSVNGSALRWAVFDPTLVPATAPPYAVFGCTTPGKEWEVELTINGGDLEYVLCPLGGWDTGTSAFTNPVLATRILTPLIPASTLTFAVGSATTGWLTVWCDNGAGVCTAVNLGYFAPYHAPGVLGQPTDDVPFATLGSAATQVATNCSRLPATANSIAANGVALDSDKVTSTSVQFMQWLWATLGTDPLTAGVNTVLNDPRTGQPDAMPFVLVQPTTPAVVRGTAQGLYAVNDALTNRTVLNGGTVYVLQNGVGVPWDTTTPV